MMIPVSSRFGNIDWHAAWHSSVVAAPGSAMPSAADQARTTYAYDGDSSGKTDFGALAWWYGG